MMKNKTKRISILAIGIALFSMFFGSGNLIFPPYLGYQAGTGTLPAMIGFSISAILFPVLAVIVIAKFDDLLHLSSMVSPKFGVIFTILVFLSLGPGLAIPRNAAVSFEMAIIPFISNPSVGLRIVYSAIFFTVSYFLSIHPESLSDTLGKYLGPILLGLMAIVAVVCFVDLPLETHEPILNYESSRVIQGFLDGYMTMDTLAALNFGNIIALNIMNKGVTEKKEIVSYTMKAGWIAGGLLLGVYLMMAYLGTLPAVADYSNGANVLTQVVSMVFGTKGIIILAIIYVLACLTTCVGLLCSCAEYFASISKMKYEYWIILFSVSSFFMSIVGLDQILVISVPILNAMYPIAIVLVVLGLFREKLETKPMVYRSTVLFTAIVSILYALSSSGWIYLFLPI